MSKYEWPKEADAFLLEHWTQLRVIDIATKLGVSRDAVLRRARKLNIEKKPVGGMRPQYYKWTAEKEDYVRQHYHSHTNDDIAKKLDVSKQALMRKMTKLGLSRGFHGRKHHAWTAQDIALLHKQFYDNIPVDLIAEEIGVSVQTVKRKIKQLGLKRKRITR